MIMADINEDIIKIISSVRGEDVRDAIVDALNKLNSSDSTAYTLNGHPASYFATQQDMERILPLDTEPRENSTRAVSSGGIYDYLEKLGDILDGINGEEI